VIGVVGLERVGQTMGCCWLADEAPTKLGLMSGDEGHEVFGDFG
jgi:hypothetical protein